MRSSSGVHVAIFAGKSAGTAPARRGSGSTFPGSFVAALDDTAAALSAVSPPTVAGHEEMPWGCRMVFADRTGGPWRSISASTAVDRTADH